MAKKINRRRPAPRQKQRTNWLIIGVVIVGGVMLMSGLLALAMREPTVIQLTDYCRNNPDRCVTQGAPGAPVTIVEVADFGCHNCRDFQQATAPLLEQQYIASGQVYWIVLPYALGPQTIPAANAAMCAGEQGAYFEFAKLMFDRFDEPDTLLPPGFVKVAEALSLDMAAFNQCLDEDRYVADIQANMAAARSAGVSGTPTFFINGQELRGAQPFTAFQQRLNVLLNS
jgi:protein-disulfide isomerase